MLFIRLKTYYLGPGYKTAIEEKMNCTLEIQNTNTLNSGNKYPEGKNYS